MLKYVVTVAMLASPLAALNAQTPPPAPPSAPSQAAEATAPVAARYSTATTEIGVLLDDPEARAILDKYVPGMSTNEQVDMARAMTLKDVQQYSPDELSDKALADLDAAFAAMPAKAK